MTIPAAEFWQYCIVGINATAAVMFAYLTWHARRRVKPATVVLGALIVAICAYPAVLWGGQVLGWWLITPEYGRPAPALLGAALLFLGILAFGQRPE